MEQHFHDIISGRRRGALALAARLGLRALETPYAGVTRLRNVAFERGWKASVSLPRPTISVGNLTVGGTGKTPITAWLAGELQSRGRKPAILMRGYASTPGEVGDEQRLLRELLGEAVPVEADPDRSKAAGRVLAQRSDVDLFLLDDAFQHRRVLRDFDLVLIDATRPFGHGHVLPRGLLREPVAGLRRASAVLLTRCDLASDVEATMKLIRQSTDAPIFHGSFAMSFENAHGTAIQLAGRPVVVACGIGNPHAFVEGVRRCGASIAGVQAFPDHHPFNESDIAGVIQSVPAGGAVATTGKDWTKLASLWPSGIEIAIARQRVDVRDGDRLVESVLRSLA